MASGLQGIKVVETASVIAGPMAGRLLADWGADVIHIDLPVRRARAQVRQSPSDGAMLAGSKAIVSDIDYGAQNHNRNKRGMTLDLSHERGQEIIYKLLEKADVFLSNFRQRELVKFKLEYDTLSQLNPGLIYANLTGYGRKGPDREKPAYEPTAYFCRTGIFHVTPMPATQPIGFGDYITGLTLAYGILTALLIRERTGIGQEVDASLFNSGVFAISWDIAGALVTGKDRQPGERKDVTQALNNSYQTKDGRWLRVAVNQPDIYWSRFCKAVERENLEHDPRFASSQAMIENHEALFHVLEEVFLTRTLEEWKPRLTEAGLPWDPVQTLPEVINDPQARANDLFVPLDHPTYGRLEVVSNPIKLSKTPETIRMPAPELDQDTEEVLSELGYTGQDIEQLREQGVIARR